MSLTITTKYLRPTNTHGARIKATPCHGKSTTIPYPYEKSGRKAHDEAVRFLLNKWGIRNVQFKVGSLECGYVYVSEPECVTFVSVEA